MLERGQTTREDPIMTCSPSIAVVLGKALKRASSIHCLRAGAGFLLRLKHRHQRIASCVATFAINMAAPIGHVPCMSCSLAVSKFSSKLCCRQR